MIIIICNLFTIFMFLCVRETIHYCRLDLSQWLFFHTQTKHVMMATQRKRGKRIVHQTNFTDHLNAQTIKLDGERKRIVWKYLGQFYIEKDKLWCHHGQWNNGISSITLFICFSFVSCALFNRSKAKCSS